MVEPHTRLRCLTPEGAAGSALRWSVVVDGLASTRPTTSTAPPSVVGVALVHGGAHAHPDGGEHLVITGEELGTRDDRIVAVTFGGMLADGASKLRAKDPAAALTLVAMLSESDSR